MLDFETSVRLARLQSRLWAALGEALREDGHRKSSDGCIEVTFSLPAAFNWDEPPTWSLTIISYVLCDEGRTKTFSGRSLSEVVGKAEDYATKICFAHEMAAFERALGAPAEDDDDTDEGEIPLPTPTQGLQPEGGR